MRKAQAAMEYLMTYGWAILVVLIALGALFYLGVFSPKTANACSPISPFNSCDIKFGTTNQISASFPTSVTAANFLSVDFSTGGTDCNPTDATLGSGTAATFICAHAMTAGTAYAGDALVSYTLSGSSIEHTVRLGFSGTSE